MSQTSGGHFISLPIPTVCTPSHLDLGPGLQSSSSWFSTDSWTASWQNKLNDCAPSEDSEQPGHPPSFIRVFAVRWMVATEPSDSEDSDQTGRMPRLIWVFAERTYHFIGFVMRRLNFLHNTINASFYERKHISTYVKVHDLYGPF